MLGLGTIISPKAKSHVLPGSLQTSGQRGSYITIPITHSLFTNNHSWSAWIKLTTSNISTTSFGYTNANRNALQAYFVNIHGQNEKESGRGLISVRQQSNHSSTEGATTNISKTDSRAGKWYNIIVTSELIDGVIKKRIFVDGVEGVVFERAQMTDSERTSFNPTGPFIFGGENRSSDSTVVHINPHSIRLSGFSAWNTVLSVNEVAGIYKGGSGIKLHKNIGNYVSSNSLVLDYNFNSGNKDGIFKSTGSSDDTARAFNCRHVVDHPSYSKGRLQG